MLTDPPRTLGPSRQQSSNLLYSVLRAYLPMGDVLSLLLKGRTPPAGPFDIDCSCWQPCFHGTALLLQLLLLLFHLALDPVCLGLNHRLVRYGYRFCRSLGI